MKAIRRFTVRTVLPEPLAGLGDLALNLRWSWHAPTRDLFESIDPATWRGAAEQDPVKLLGLVPRERLDQLADDEGFRSWVNDLSGDLSHYLTEDRWYQSLGPDRPTSIAYFSPEYGIAEALPQYSGGLGILAGDHLKTASDLGVPITGVGLLYRHGYFKQSLSREGWQLERYPVLDPVDLPIAVLREPDGTEVKIAIALPGGRQLVARVWTAQVGRVPLLLLDSDVEDNEPSERDVTDRLYGGGGEHRLLQEMLLGIGGVRALRAFSRITGAPAPEVFHTNEGHAGFLGIERIRELIETEKMTFDEALEATRAGTLFTTHTPVPAGIDRFPRDLVAQHFASDVACPGVPVDKVLALGAETYAGGDPHVFNMAVKGLRLAQRANGVARLHGEVSRGMFAGLWPDFDQDEIPIQYVTNGVHAPSWVAREILALGAHELHADLSGDGRAFEAVDRASDEQIWSIKHTLREHLVRDARERLRTSWLARGASPAELGWINSVLDPDVLTIGFARRVPSYKRLTLMMRDPERLTRLLLHPERPVQIVVAGKAHPADDTGKQLIQQLVKFTDDPAVRHRIVFLPDYGISLAQALYPGCDVWLNNPLRPLEACGTSGMKAALNGGLNLSILDGWWDEMYDGQNGWAIPTADGVDDVDKRDDLEAAALYDLVEHQVAPRFYDRGEHGLPHRWIEMVRHTLKTLGTKVVAERMLRDYVLQLYTPAALAARAVDGTAGHPKARELAAWKARVRAAWDGVAVEHLEVSGLSSAPELGEQMHVRAFIALGEIKPADVQVQVVHGRVDSDDRLSHPATTALDLSETYEAGRYCFDGQVALQSTGPFGYTVRVVPSHPLLSGPAELGLAAVPSTTAPAELWSD